MLNFIIVFSSFDFYCCCPGNLPEPVERLHDACHARPKPRVLALEPDNLLLAAPAQERHPGVALAYRHQCL